jgi:hypothetical protein
MNFGMRRLRRSSSCDASSSLRRLSGSSGTAKRGSVTLITGR